MRWVRTLAVVLVTAALAASAGFAVGGRVGFYEGFGVSTYSNQMIRGVIAANLLRIDDPKEMASDLERAVDGALVIHSAYSGILEDRPFYAPKEFYDVDRSKMVRPVATYRRDHAGVMTDPSVLATIRAVVERNAEPPAAP